MSNSLINFADLIQQTKIRIPKIQRDYAQGRICRNVDGIRKDFIHVLMLVVKGKREKTELDFIYGSSKDNAFEPLDGQQRLTTLFLLYWIFGINLKTEDGKHSMFTYETRNTSQEFCDELVQHSAKKLIEEAEQKNKAEKEKFERLKSETINAKEYANPTRIKSKQEPKKINPSDIIRCRDWFKFEWRSDPTILSMLVVIDAICDEIGDGRNKIFDEGQKKSVKNNI